MFMSGGKKVERRRNGAVGGGPLLMFCDYNSTIGLEGGRGKKVDVQNDVVPFRKCCTHIGPFFRWLMLRTNSAQILDINPFDKLLAVIMT